MRDSVYDIRVRMLALALSEYIGEVGESGAQDERTRKVVQLGEGGWHWRIAEYVIAQKPSKPLEKLMANHMSIHGEDSIDHVLTDMALAHYVDLYLADENEKKPDFK